MTTPAHERFTAAFAALPLVAILRGLRPDEALVGQSITRVRGLDEQGRERLGALDAPHRAARNHEVVAGLEAQVPVVAEELARSRMHEEEGVAVGVARQRARSRATPEAHPRVRIEEEFRRRPGRGCGGD